MPSGRALSLSPVCGFGAGQRVCKIVEREREREREREHEVVVVRLGGSVRREETPLFA
jgi:hypothetical protein